MQTDNNQANNQDKDQPTVKGDQAQQDVKAKSQEKDVTLEDVVLAIKDLESRNIKLTLRNLRDTIGRGSLSTIQKLKSQYLICTHNNAFTSIKLNAGMNETAEFMLKQITNLLSKLHHDNIDKLQKDSNAIISTLVASNTEEREELELRVKQLEDELAEKEIEKTNLNSQLIIAEQNLTKANEDLASAKLELEHLKDTKLLIDKLKEDMLKDSKKIA